MLVHSQKRSAAVATPSLVPEPRVAVLLNSNAKRVSDKVIHRISHVVPPEDLYVSRTMDDCRAIAAKVVEKRYHTVFTGGGDGTFMSFANEIFAQMAKQGVARPPRFGVLRLGTGNSLANLVGASSLSGDGILDDVLRARAGEVPSVRRLELLDIDGQSAPMVGVGYDGAVLNDYVDVTRSAGPARGLVAGGLGYGMAIALKTFPRYVAGNRPVQVEVVCEGKGMRMAADGSVAKQYSAGDVLYRGPAYILCAGTVPCYGFNFKMFPFAGKKRGLMQLRVSNASPLTCISHIPSMWKGEWRHPDLHDFLVDSASVRFEKPMPLQVGGDAAGYKAEFNLKMAPQSVDLVDFTASMG